MTERLDLSAVAPSSGETDRVVGAVMARVRREASAPAPGVLEAIGISVPLRWIAAAAVLVAAAALGLTSRRTDTAPPLDVVAQWASQQHVPSNAELLMAFQGYRQ